MKKTLAIVLGCLLAVCMLCGCESKATGGNGNGAALVTAAQVDENLRAFLGITDAMPDGDLGNRTPTSASEEEAAKRLYARYADGERYAHLTVTELRKTQFEVSVNNATRTSHNVEIRLKVPGATKQVVIGAGYDTPYGEVDPEYVKLPATGAFANGTGVATVMGMIDWCNAHYEELIASVDFDLVFVFYGCSSYNSRGADAYIAQTMTAQQRLNTLLSVSVDKLGGERMYLYTDEVQTPHEEFLRDVASQNGLPYYTLPDNMPLIDGVYIDGLNYTHFGMLGDHAPYIEWKIPAAYITSGYYGGFNLSDLEKKGDSNLAGTEHDTYRSLLSDRAEYAKQGSDTATLLLRAVCAEGFTAAMENARAQKKDYSFWTSPLWAYLIVIFVIIALGIVLVVLVKLFEKKYPYKPVVKRMKIAVFGMDYETPADEDIFVDIKKNAGPRNPFDGY